MKPEVGEFGPLNQNVRVTVCIIRYIGSLDIRSAIDEEFRIFEWYRFLLLVVDHAFAEARMLES